MTALKAAPSLVYRYRWTADDISRRQQATAAGQPPTAQQYVTPYGVSPREQRTVELIHPLSHIQKIMKTLPELKDGELIRLPLSYSNAWLPHRTTRFFDDDYKWESISGVVPGKTIGGLCAALHKADPARYPHYDFSIVKNVEEGWRIFDYWEHTDHRWAFMKSGKFARDMDPFSIPLVMPNPDDPKGPYKLIWVRCKLASTQTAVVAPTPQGDAKAPKHPTVVPLLLAVDKDSWQMRLVKDKVLAIAVGRAPFSDLANGAFGNGVASPGTKVDLTPSFPAWVRTALTAQLTGGYIGEQPDPAKEPAEFQRQMFDLGYGNCHGFTSKMFGLFDNEPLRSWIDMTASYAAAVATTTAPPGAPSKMSDVDPRHQQVRVGSSTAQVDMPLHAHAQRDKPDQVPAARWAGIIDIGKNLIVRRILASGGVALQAGAALKFGDLGASKRNDHSVVFLGVAAGAPALGYALQKMAPNFPYAVYTQKIAEFDWFRFTKPFGQPVTPGKVP